MKTNVAIEIPISNGKHIKLPGPCTYCGEPAAEGGKKKWTTPYQLKHWGVSRKFGNMQLWDSKGADGVARKGQVTVHAPYCPEHLEGVKLFTMVLAIGTIGVAIGGIILGIVTSESETFLMRAFMIGVSMVMGASIGFILAWLINKLIALVTPAFRDFPALGNGHWGLSTDNIRVDGGEFGVGPVRYYLTLNFLNIESAQRFLAAYPEAVVVKGEELL